LCVFDKISKIWDNDADVNATAQSPWLYGWQTSEGAIDKRIEEFWSKIESPVRILYKGLRRWQLEKSALTANELAVFLPFISAMAVRVPFYLDLTHAEISRVIYSDLGVSHGFTERPHRDLSPDTDPLRNIFLKEIVMHCKALGEVFAHYDWTFLYSGQSYFITTDRPVTILGTEGTDLTGPGITVIFSLSKNFAVKGTSGTGKLVGLGLCEKRDVEAFNQTLYAAAPRQIVSPENIPNILSWHYAF
jgi:hypothetical protein